MLRQMERSAIQVMAKRGKNIRQIAGELGRSPTTISRALREPMDRVPAPRRRRSQVDPYRPHIERWLEEGLSVVRMLELARDDPDDPYTACHPVLPLLSFEVQSLDLAAVDQRHAPGDALTVESTEAVLKWKTYLQHLHVMVAGPYRHEAYTNIIFVDPEGVQLELATRGPGWDTTRDPEEVYIPPKEMLAPFRDEAEIELETWPEPITEITRT